MIQVYCSGYYSSLGLQGSVAKILYISYRVLQVGCQPANVKVVVTMQTNEANPPIVIKPDSHCVVTTASSHLHFAFDNQLAKLYMLVVRKLWH